jgi:hypothetical protein
MKNRTANIETISRDGEHHMLGTSRLAITSKKALRALGVLALVLLAVGVDVRADEILADTPECPREDTLKNYLAQYGGDSGCADGGLTLSNFSYNQGSNGPPADQIRVNTSQLHKERPGIVFSASWEAAPGKPVISEIRYGERINGIKIGSASILAEGSFKDGGTAVIGVAGCPGTRQYSPGCKGHETTAIRLSQEKRSAQVTFPFASPPNPELAVSDYIVVESGNGAAKLTTLVTVFGPPPPK